MAKKWFVYTRTIVSAEELPFKDAPTIVFVRPTDLTPQPGNPFTAVATVTGATGAPTAWLVDADGHQILPSMAPTSAGNNWTFTFGTALNPIAAGYYLLTVQALNGPNTTKKTEPVLIGT